MFAGKNEKITHYGEKGGLGSTLLAGLRCLQTQVFFKVLKSTAKQVNSKIQKYALGAQILMCCGSVNNTE